MRATRYGLPLVEREVEILRAIADGESYHDIAADKYLAWATVRNYAFSAMKKLGATTQAQAVRIAYESGILVSPPAVQMPGVLVQVLQLVAEGMSNAEIARRLERSEHTVADQVREARRRLGARDRAQAAALAVALRLVRVSLPVPEAASPHAA
jgi:DNA-binding NarL/FixJ family response regulator